MTTKTINYKITWDELEQKGDAKIPESLKPLLQDLHNDIQNRKPNVIGRLQKLIQKYPNNLQLKNHLSTAYESVGKLQKAMEVNDLILETNPDYLFARLNKASQFHEEGEYEKMQEILGKGFDLKTLYPDREVFHISEFMGMQELAVRYYTATGNFDQANKRLELMQELDKDAPQYRNAREVFTFASLRKAIERREMEEKQRITPQNQFHLKKKEFKRPEFNISATAELYNYDFDIPNNVLQQFFDHDRDQVIEDLENVLKDSYYNFDIIDFYEYSEEPFAPVHALFLLGDLEAEESLPVVLEMMQQNEDYYDEIFGDIFTEAGWIPLLKLGKNRLDLLADYLTLPGTYTYFRATVSEALEQVWLHFPDKRLEVEYIIRDLLDYLIEATPDDNVIDSDFNGFLISGILHLNLVQFLPQTKKLYEKGYVSTSICGTFEDVERDIKDDIRRPPQKRDLKNTKELYNQLSTIMGESPSRFDADPFEPKIQPVVHTSKKIGRNDPCPCGSGKKYKKCCLHKNIF